MSELNYRTIVLFAEQCIKIVRWRCIIFMFVLEVIIGISILTLITVYACLYYFENKNQRIEL